jgi:hypothetical protein
MQTKISLILFLVAFSIKGLGQSNKHSFRDSITDYKYSISSTWLSFVNFGEKKTNTQHYELHIKYALTPKDKVGIKLTTWSLFQPMGIVWWDDLLHKIETESEFYPGRLKEVGIGVSYQRLLWKGLFATVEVLPQFKTYVDFNNQILAKGFKLYTSYHLGYHISLFNQRMFIEPQIHCQNWMIDTKAPQGFHELDSKWRNYFLFEPNLYIGFNF